MWCLARILPLMMGELVPEHNLQWENYLLMLTITDYIFAPVTSADISAYIKTLIKDHHDSFRDLYPLTPVIPKMHYIIHLPEWMTRYAYYVHISLVISDVLQIWPTFSLLVYAL